jgi:hypothetical protein
LIQKNQNFNPTTGGNQEPNMLPPTCRPTPAFGSGQRAGTELSLALGVSRYSTKLNDLSGSP